MTYRSTYTGLYSGIGAMLSKPWLHKPCRDAALKIQEEAQSVSPVGDPEEDRHPGLFKASFWVEPINVNVPFRGKPRIRAGARVMNSAPHAWRVEHGDGRVPRYAPFQKAVDAVKAGFGG